MRIRTQLIAAAFLLAVIPLTAIVGYSYYSSREALELACILGVRTAASGTDRLPGESSRIFGGWMVRCGNVASDGRAYDPVGGRGQF